MTAAETDALPPDGFRRLPASSGNAFLSHCGDLWGRLEGEEAVIAFRVASHHCNRMGQCHGGMLLTFADSFLPVVVRIQGRAEDGITPTVSLSADFVNAAHLGDWVEGRGRLLRRSGRLLFTEGWVSVNRQSVMRVSAIFKRGHPGDSAARLAELITYFEGPG